MPKAIAAAAATTDSSTAPAAEALVVAEISARRAKAAAARPRTAARAAKMPEPPGLVRNFTLLISDRGGSSAAAEPEGPRADPARPDLAIPFVARPVFVPESGRECFVAYLTPPLPIPVSGLVSLTEARSLGPPKLMPYVLTAGNKSAGAAEWAQLNAANEPEVVQFLWRPGPSQRATLERAIIQARLSPALVDRARVLAL